MDNSSTTLGAAFGTELRELRHRAQMSQEQLAFEAGVHRTYISLLERGQKIPTLDTLFKICAALNVNPEDVVASVRRRMSTG